MNRNTVSAWLISLLPAFAAAQGASYTCSLDGLQRRVEIVTEPGVSVPCEVHYYKDTEAPGERQVLWRASNDAEYCEKKTGEFVGQMLAWGWTCSQADPAATGPGASPGEPAPVDDDEAVEPPGPAPVEDADVIEPPDLDPAVPGG